MRFACILFTVLHLLPSLRVLFSPTRMIMVSPRHYCVILNPVTRDDQGHVQFDTAGQAKLRHADLEIRLTQDPFPLYPGEEIQKVDQFIHTSFCYILLIEFFLRVNELMWSVAKSTFNCLP